MLLFTLSWLSSLALAAPSEAVRNALITGDCPKVVAELKEPETEALALALARCQLRLGEATPALRWLERVQDPGLLDHAGALRAEALLLAGRAEEAEAAMARVQLGGEAGARLSLLRGRTLVELQRYEEARTVLSGLLAGPLGEAGRLPEPGGPDPGEVRWWLAQGAIRRGEPEKAVPVMRAIWARNPSSPFAEPAAEWLAQRGSPVGDRTSEEGKALIRERSATMQKQKRYAEALALEDSLGVVRSAAEEARLAFRAKDYARAIAAWERAGALSPSQRFDQALASSRIGDHETAARRYAALVQDAPTSPQADEASYKLGYLAYDQGKLEAALPLFEAHLRRYPASSFAADARWFIAWSLVRLERYAEADAAFSAFAQAHPKSELCAYAAWWRAWIQDKRGDTAGARAAWQAVTERYPVSGAAWLASEKLGQRMTGVGTKGPPPAMPASLQNEAWRRAQTLLEAGLLDWARPELLSLVKPARELGPSARIPLALALVEAGEYTLAQDLAGPSCGQPWRGGGDAWALRACYPRPNASVVAAVAAESGLHPLLPYAIMNAESALKPQAASPAGARGLMQLMPEVAARHHLQRRPALPFQSDELFQPAYNAWLGTAELGALALRFRDSGVKPNLPLVIAGYNGGPEAVERWLRAYASPPEGARFAEDIGYTETRRYVRRVLGYLQQYRWVYGDP